MAKSIHFQLYTYYAHCNRKLMTVYPVLQYLMEVDQYLFKEQQDNGLSLNSKVWSLNWLLK